MADGGKAEAGDAGLRSGSTERRGSGQRLHALEALSHLLKGL